MNIGVIYDEHSRPLAYRLLRPSMQFAQSLEYDDIPASSLYVTYNPDWSDQGRGTSAISHALRRSFMVGELYEAELKAVLAQSKTALIEYNDSGTPDKSKSWIHGGGKGGETFQNLQGDPVFFEDIDDGTIRYFRSNSGNKLEMPTSQRPHENVPAFIEVILKGMYQGLPWPFEFTRSSKETGGADLRGVVMEKVNRIVGNLYTRLFRIAHHAATYALSVEIDRKELPPGDWGAIEFPMPPKLTADRWRQYQEDRDNFVIGHDTLQNIAATRGQHWADDIRAQRDIEEEDKFQRCETLVTSHRERMEQLGLADQALTFREVLEMYEQRSPNPAVQHVAEAKETGADGAPATPAKAGNQGDEA